MGLNGTSWGLMGLNGISWDVMGLIEMRKKVSSSFSCQSRECGRFGLKTGGEELNLGIQVAFLPRID